MNATPLTRVGTLGLFALACSVGSGEGSAESESLFVDGCWEGPFKLEPTFFAANPFDNSLTIRVQRGEQDIQVSDGFTLLVNNVSTIRSERLNQSLSLGLPVGVVPLGFALPETPTPPDASLSLYLNSSCRNQNAQLSAISGEVVFEKLFSGDLNEENSDARLTLGTFTATVVDLQAAIPAPAGSDGPSFTYEPEDTSQLEGRFRFYFHRGTPAQPFP